MNTEKILKRKLDDIQSDDCKVKKPKIKHSQKTLEAIAEFIRNKKQKRISQKTSIKVKQGNSITDTTDLTDKTNDLSNKPKNIDNCKSGIKHSETLRKGKQHQLKENHKNVNSQNSLQTDCLSKDSSASNKSTSSSPNRKREWKRKSECMRDNERRTTNVHSSPKDRKDFKKEEDIQIHLPNKPEEISTNWDKLRMVLDKDKPAIKKNPKHEKLSYSKVKGKKLNKKHPKLQNESVEKKPEIWFDDVDDIFIDTSKTTLAASTQSGAKHKKDPLVKTGSFTGLTKAVAMDCEMVGIGYNGKQNMLARVSIVNQTGHCLYDKYVQPQEEVTDYRTHVSGIRKEDLNKGEKFDEVCKDVAGLLKGRILVGHAIQNDLKVLYISHPKKCIRDTSKFKPFRQLFDGKTPSLKKLTARVLSVEVQEGEHNSVQDAQAAMRLYTMYKKQWEKELGAKRSGIQKKTKLSKQTHLSGFKLEDSD